MPDSHYKLASPTAQATLGRTVEENRSDKDDTVLKGIEKTVEGWWPKGTVVATGAVEH